MNIAVYNRFCASLNSFFSKQTAPIYGVIAADKIGNSCICLLKRDEFTDSTLPAKSSEHTFAIYEVEILEDGSYSFDADAPIWFYYDRWTNDGDDTFGPNPTFGTLSYEEVVALAQEKYQAAALELYRDYSFDEELEQKL